MCSKLVKKKVLKYKLESFKYGKKNQIIKFSKYN